MLIIQTQQLSDLLLPLGPDEQVALPLGFIGLAFEVVLKLPVEQSGVELAGFEIIAVDFEIEFVAVIVAEFEVDQFVPALGLSYYLSPALLQQFIDADWLDLDTQLAQHEIMQTMKIEHFDS